MKCQKCGGIRHGGLTPECPECARERTASGPSDATDCSAERLARELALNYYQGQLRERYSDTLLLRTYCGPVADNPETAQLWIEEQAQDHANQFWKCWEDEAAKLLLPNS